MINAPILRHDPEKSKSAFESIKRFKINIVLDNLYDTFNIGSAFRLADGINAQKVIITGKDSAKPPNSKIRKASMCICDYLPWDYYETLEEILNKGQSTWIIVEKTDTSSNYRDWCSRIVDHAKRTNSTINILVGNESYGVNPIAFSYGKVVHIPMYGLNNSMNVINALTVVGEEIAYWYSKND